MSRADGGQIRVLHVDDDPDVCEVVALHLERERDDLSVVTEHSAEAGLARLAETDVDCVVSDHDMPGTDGLEFLEAVRERYPELPFILFTGKGNEEIASEAISAGVTEYLQKGVGTDHYALLANRIERAVSETRAKSALEESERMLSTLIANLPGMVYQCRNEPGWPMSFVSEGAKELTGYDPERIERGDVSWGEDVIADDDEEEEVWRTVQRALETNEPFELTYRIRTADDETKWIWERGRAVEEGGDGTAIEGFITDITDRKERKRELERERAFTADVVNAIDDAFYVVSAEGEFIRWNDTITEVTGYSDAELSAMNVTDLFPEEYRQTVVDSAATVLEAGSAEFEAELLRSDGTQCPYEFRSSVFPGLEGNRTAICGIGRDVSERRERERELERYRTLVESVGDPMYVMDADGTTAMVNKAMADHVGYDREEIVGESPRKFATDASVDRANELIKELIADDERTWATFEMETISADGTHTENEDKIAVLTDDQGRYRGSVGVIRDISDRKERERELERYETIIQAVGDPVYTLNEDGEFTFVNEAMEDLAGYDRDELLGEHISTIMVPDDVETGEQLIGDLLEETADTYETFEMDVVTRAERHVPCETHVALLPLDDGSFRGTAGIVRDITERKERERRLEEFASVVSHDLRNPLNVVQGRLDLIEKTGDPDHVRAAADAADRMERLIDDLLRLAREGESLDAVEPVELAALAREAWDHVVAPDAELVVETSGTLEADPDRFVELLENLFHNAVEHGRADGDGELRVRVGRTAEGFYVEDDGVGIDPGRREAVFERGHTTGEGGSGFGLAIVESIATAHGWRVTVTDGRDGGARFEFET